MILLIHYATYLILVFKKKKCVYINLANVVSGMTMSQATDEFTVAYLYIYVYIQNKKKKCMYINLANVVSGMTMSQATDEFTVAYLYIYVYTE